MAIYRATSGNFKVLMDGFDNIIMKIYKIEDTPREHDTYHCQGEIISLRSPAASMEMASKMWTQHFSDENP
jgi:hypothetical protein